MFDRYHPCPSFIVSTDDQYFDFPECFDDVFVVAFSNQLSGIVLPLLIGNLTLLFYFAHSESHRSPIFLKIYVQLISFSIAVGSHSFFVAVESPLLESAHWHHPGSARQPRPAATAVLSYL